MVVVLRLFCFSSRCSEADGIWKCKRSWSLRRAGVTESRTTFEVVEAELFLELLVRLRTAPGFDRGCEHLKAGISRQVRHIVFCSPVDRRSLTSQTSSPGMHAHDYRAFGAYGHPQRGYGRPRRDMSADLWCPAASRSVAICSRRLMLQQRPEADPGRGIRGEFPAFAMGKIRATLGG